MAQVSFGPEKVSTPLDAKLEELAAVATLAGRPIRVRLQPDFYNYDKRTYDAWAGLTWTLDLDEVEEGRRLREGLGMFLKLFGDPEKQKAVLDLLAGL